MFGARDRARNRFNQAYKALKPKDRGLKRTKRWDQTDLIPYTLEDSHGTPKPLGWSSETSSSFAGPFDQVPCGSRDPRRISDCTGS